MISLLSEIRWDWNTPVKYKTLYRGDAAAIIQKNCYGTEENQLHLFSVTQVSLLNVYRTYQYTQRGVLRKIRLFGKLQFFDWILLLKYKVTHAVDSPETGVHLKKYQKNQNISIVNNKNFPSEASIDNWNSSCHWRREKIIYYIFSLVTYNIFIIIILFPSAVLQE